jgi:hypothetical protein
VKSIINRGSDQVSEVKQFRLGLKSWDADVLKRAHVGVR